MNAQAKRTSKILTKRISEKKSAIARYRLAGNDVGTSVALTALKRYQSALDTIASL
tara:strand:- start:400 stop:567 length:168 start_codon:yes stop_codon:yes gene_type:complete